MNSTAREIIERLGLQPHPEGGWYRETWRAHGENGARGAVTAIHFLLEPGQRPLWRRRIDATEVWLRQAGGPVLLTTATGPEISSLRLGPDILAGDRLRANVAPALGAGAGGSGVTALRDCYCETRSLGSGGHAKCMPT